MLKKRNDKGEQTTVEQNGSSRLKQSHVWLHISIVVAVVLSLILFRVEGQPFQWRVNARDWTGFGQSYDNDVSTVAEKGTETTGTTTKTIDKTTTTTKRLQAAKTLWDWMTLLLAPATLAGLGFVFQSSQEKAKRDKEEADKARDAAQQREQALQAYFDQLSALLVDKQLKKLLPAKQANLFPNVPTEKDADGNAAAEAMTVKPELSIDAEAALDVVKARTLSLLRLFDDDMPRKASVLSFLGDADLFKQLDLDLSGIRLYSVNLKRVNFSSCKLRSANLHSAILKDANLYSANLRDANLCNADLSFANLNVANLRGAILRDAIIIGADLSGTNLQSADLSGTNLQSAYLTYADLQSADLQNANLQSADLSDANLSDADFSTAHFWDSKLTGDDLDRAQKDAVVRIQSAQNWQKAHYNTEIRALLISPETPETETND